jgi:hypothetical protein
VVSGEADVGTLETSGVTIRPLPDGTVSASAERVAVRQFRARVEWGAVDIAEAVLTGVLARLSMSSPSQQPELIEMSADHIRVGGTNCIVNEWPAVKRTEASALDADALIDMDGVLRAFVTDALWIIDAEIVIPVVQGRIDFDRVIVEHVGPNSSMRIGPTGIHVDAPHRARIDLLAFAMRDVAGVSPRAAGASGDRGRLELAPFVRAAFAAPAGEPVARLADSRLDGALQRTRLSGELRMGNGALGTATRRVVLTGREQGSNRFEVSSLAVGQRVIVRAAHFMADSGAFAVADRVLTTGRVSAELEAHLINLHGNADSPAIAVAIQQATFERVRVAQR